MSHCPHRRRIATVLLALDGKWLERAHCNLGGAVALMLQLGAYRETRGIDFFCGSKAGFRFLRNAVARADLGGLLTRPGLEMCGTHCSQNMVEVFIAVNGQPVRLTFACAQPVRGYRVKDALFDVPLLSRKDLFVSKLLANTDRGLNDASLNRDIIDLAMMVKAWGPVPQVAWQEATLVYGAEVARSLIATCGLMSDRVRVIRHLWMLAMYTSLADSVCKTTESLCESYRASMLSALGDAGDHVGAAGLREMGGAA